MAHMDSISSAGQNIGRRGNVSFTSKTAVVPLARGSVVCMGPLKMRKWERSLLLTKFRARVDRACMRLVLIRGARVAGRGRRVRKENPSGQKRSPRGVQGLG